MYKLNTRFLGLILGGLCVFNTNAADGPNYKPPYLVDSTQKENAVLMEKTIANIDMPYFQCGNKKITVREWDNKLKKEYDTSFGIKVNDTEVCRLAFTGSFQKDGKWYSGRPFKIAKQPVLSIDKANQAINYSKSYIRPDGQSATFTYQLKATEPGKIILSWDTGLNTEECAGFARENRYNLGINFSLQRHYRKDGVSINGKELAAFSEEDMKTKKAHNIPKVTSFAYNLKNPVNGFELLIPESHFVIRESFRKSVISGDHHSLFIRSFTTPMQEKGEMIIDLKETIAGKKDIYPPVETVDFWGEDAIHYPKQPTRNLMPNSSFEQGLRYWKWGYGGATYTPSDIRRYDVVDGGLFGRKMLVINPVQRQSMCMSSFSLPSKKNQTYTISYYAKAEKSTGIRMWPFSTQTGGKFSRSGAGKYPWNKLSKEWQRFSFTIKGDGQMYALWLNSGSTGKVYVDGIQVEVGETATEYVAPPAEGYLTTSDPDNSVEYGDPINATMEFTLTTGNTGKVELTLRDYFKKELYTGTFTVTNNGKVKLPFADLNLGTGVYSIKAKFMIPGTETYYDYFRFSIVKSLNGKHKTRTLYGQLFGARDSRADDYQALIKRYGFGGSTTYGAGKANEPEVYKLREKYGIVDYLHCMSINFALTKEQRKLRFKDPDFKFYAGLKRFWLRPAEKKVNVKIRRYTPEILVKVEKDAERVARENPYVRVWAFGTEEETSMPAIKERDFKEYAKLQAAFYRGIKKGNPKALNLPSGGTSGYASWRGADIVNGMLDATKGKIKWDGVAIHPYGSVDGTCGYDDLDVALQLLRDNMAERGYGQDTPMLLTEGGAGTTNTTFKGGNVWDYTGGHLSYDFGLREFVNGSRVIRSFIICLKYWPQLEHYNIWWDPQRGYLDQELALNASMNGVNTLGHLLDDPRFIADIRPAPKMRGYAFENKGQGVASVWATMDEVDKGVTYGPVMVVKFNGKLPKLYDMMGREWPLHKDSKGYSTIQLTSSPIFLTAENPKMLADDLNNAEVRGIGSSIKVSFKPAKDGNITLTAQNELNREQQADISVNDQAYKAAITNMQSKLFTIPTGNKPVAGKIYKWQGNYSIKQQSGPSVSGTSKIDYFYVPHVEGTPDWDKVPTIKMTNLYRPVHNTKQTPGGHKGDIEAEFKIAWNKDNLYVRVEAEDDIFNLDNPKFWNSDQAKKNQLYMLDGCLELYLDCAANGRTGTGSFDLDDYRYDFCVGNPEGKSGPGLANRLREPFTEYALGTQMPTKDEVRKKVKCEFQRLSDTKYVYTITLGQRYLEPMRLEKGSVTGFALYLHDRMDDGTYGKKGRTLATEPGLHCDNNPKVWPLMILQD